MEFITLEVDGSFANPLVVGAVTIWAAVFATVAVVLAKRAARGSSLSAAVVVVFLFTAATPVVQKTLATILYSALSLRLVGVGFWGGLPFWPAPVVGLLAGATAFWFARHPATPGG